MCKISLPHSSDILNSLHEYSCIYSIFSDGIYSYILSELTLWSYMSFYQMRINNFWGWQIFFAKGASAAFRCSVLERQDDRHVQWWRKDEDIPGFSYVKFITSCMCFNSSWKTMYIWPLPPILLSPQILCNYAWKLKISHFRRFSFLFLLFSLPPLSFVPSIHPSLSFVILVFLRQDFSA